MESDVFQKFTDDDYKQVFVKILPIAEHHLKLLHNHFLAENHTITASQLACIMGYANHNAVNLHYGKFGKRICEALQEARKYHDLESLVTFYKPENEHWQLILRPQVAEALKKLKWFG